MTSTLASKFHHAHSFLVSVSYHDQSLWLTRSRETVMQRPQEARNFCRFFFSWCAKISLRKTKFSQKNFLHWRNYTYKHYMKNLGAIYFKFLFRSETKLEGYKSSAGKIKTTNSKWNSPILRTALALGLQCIQRRQENVDICFEKFTCVSIRRTWLDEKHWCRKIFHYFAEAHLKNIYCYWNTLESLSKFQKSHIEWHLCNVFWFSQLQAVMSETRHGYHG